MLCALAGVLIALPKPALAACFGDCSGTGTMDAADLVRLFHIAVGNTDVSACTAGDANGDRGISPEDIDAAIKISSATVTSYRRPTECSPVRPTKLPTRQGA